MQLKARCCPLIILKYCKVRQYNGDQSSQQSCPHPVVVVGCIATNAAARNLFAAGTTLLAKKQERIRGDDLGTTNSAVTTECTFSQGWILITSAIDRKEYF